MRIKNTRINKLLVVIATIILSFCFCACTASDVEKVVDKIQENPDAIANLVNQAQDVIDEKDASEIEQLLPTLTAQLTLVVTSEPEVNEEPVVDPVVEPTSEPDIVITPESAITEPAVPAATNILVPTATNTPAPTATNTPAPTATNTPVPTATNTPVPTPTNTPKPTATNTPVPTATNTPKPTATNTPKPTATNTPKPTATNTPTPTATNTPKPTATNTPTPTAINTPKPTNTPRTEYEGDRYNKPETDTYYSIPGDVDKLPAIYSNPDGKTLGEIFKVKSDDIAKLKFAIAIMKFYDDASDNAAAKKRISGITNMFSQTPVLYEDAAYVTWYEFVMTFQTEFSSMINDQNQLMNFFKKLARTKIDFSNLDINAEITRHQAAALLWVFKAPSVKAIDDAILYNKNEYSAKFLGTFKLGSDIAPAVFLLTNDYFGPQDELPRQIDPGMKSYLAWVDLAYWYEVYYK